jgi:hypothetical protein
VEPVGVQPGGDVGVGEDVADDELGRIMLGLRAPGGEDQVGADGQLARGEHVHDRAGLAGGQRLGGVREADVDHVQIVAVEGDGQVVDALHALLGRAQRPLARGVSNSPARAAGRESRTRRASLNASWEFMLHG